MMDVGGYGMSASNIGLEFRSDDAHCFEVLTNVGNSPGSGGNDSPGAPDGLIRQVEGFATSLQTL